MLSSLTHTARLHLGQAGGTSNPLENLPGPHLRWLNMLRKNTKMIDWGMGGRVVL